VEPVEKVVESGPDATARLYWCDIPKVRPAGDDQASVTAAHFDKSAVLEALANSVGGAKDVLGECQMAFVCFVLGHSVDAFYHWKALWGLISTCDAYATANPAVFADAIRVFYAQLQQLPKDLFEDELLKGNFLGEVASSLLEICQDLPGCGQRASYLRELLSVKFNMDPADFLDGPTVVNAEELEALGIPVVVDV
jgi:A1 cistron-splicing factor AAR2